MFKKVTKIALAGIIGVGTMIGASSSASAEPVATYDSEAKIQFEANTDPTDPVDPTEPTDPVDPVDPEELPDVGTEGPLSIDYISNFNFGTLDALDATSKTEDYEALPVTITPKAAGGGPKEVAPYAQVTDKRGTNTGWTLSVEQDGELSTEDDAEFLEGAKITIGKGKTVGTLVDEAEIFTTGEVELVPEGGVVPVFGTNEGTIGGTFINSFSETNSTEDINVKLTIDKGTAVVTGEEYTTD